MKSLDIDRRRYGSSRYSGRGTYAALGDHLAAIKRYWNAVTDHHGNASGN